MTTVYDTQIKCAVCRISSEQYGVGSTNSFGSSDLDTRPPEMERSTIEYWVQRCPHCGYCSSEIEQAPESAKEIISLDEYRMILKNKSYPKLANSFLCQSYIYEALEDYASAAWAKINAAWACDDRKKKEGAKQCRIKAFELIQKLWGNDELLMGDKPTDYALLADLLRRSGKFELAGEIIKKGFDANPDEMITDLLCAQKFLVEKRVDLCYTVEEAQKLVEEDSTKYDDDSPF